MADNSATGCTACSLWDFVRREALKLLCHPATRDLWTPPRQHPQRSSWQAEHEPKPSMPPSGFGSSELWRWRHRGLQVAHGTHVLTGPKSPVSSQSVQAKPFERDRFGVGQRHCGCQLSAQARDEVASVVGGNMKQDHERPAASCPARRRKPRLHHPSRGPNHTGKDMSSKLTALDLPSPSLVKLNLCVLAPSLKRRFAAGKQCEVRQAAST